MKRTLRWTFLPATTLLFVVACSHRPVQNHRTEPAWSVHAQTTYNVQTHSTFTAPYQGANSLQDRREGRGSFTATGFIGRTLWRGGEFYANPEAIAGSGLSGVLGLAGPPNGETYRVDSQKLRLTLARAFMRQTWSLGGPTETVTDSANQVASIATRDRLVVTAGKFSGSDIFDDNSYAHDPRTQFNNWSVWETASWDYAADTRGYTYGFSAELTRNAWTGRLGFFLEPRAANGIHLDRDERHAHGDVFELEHDHTLEGHEGKVRGMAFVNHARMGSYREALDRDPTAPDVTTTRKAGRIKFGFGLNAEQSLSSWLGAFLRAGWNDGHTEAWAFDEIERTIAIGLSATPVAMHRPNDRIGLAIVENGATAVHREYLASGGYGFMLGDGRLRYGSEHVVDTYYSWQIDNLVSFSAELQRYANLAFNRDRGPLVVYGVRVHIQY